MAFMRQLVFLAILGYVSANVAVPLQPNPNALPAHVYANVNHRQTPGAGGLAGLFGGLGNLGGLGGGISSFLPSMMSTALPLLMVMGLGALLMPLLGGALFLREGKDKRGSRGFNMEFVDTLTDILGRVATAIEESQKKYS